MNPAPSTPYATLRAGAQGEGDCVNLLLAPAINCNLTLTPDTHAPSGNSLMLFRKRYLRLLLLR